MIIYNDIDLEERAPVKIEDIVVSPIQLNPVARQRSLDWGSEFIRMYGAQRTITITFALLERRETRRETYMYRIRNWARTTNNKEYPLILPEFDDRYLVCACTQLPEHSYRKWWENKLRIVFTCFDNPFWTANELKEVKCGTVFTVGGNVAPLMTIERKGSALKNQTYATSSYAMTFSQIPKGTLTIDLNRQTADVGGTSIMKYYSPTSKWIIPKSGSNQKITGNGTIKYRERWV